MPDHFALPFRLAAGRAVVVSQDTPAEISQCVEVVLRCPQGFRLELPEFGLPEQAFRQGGADATVIEAVIEEWEPRAAAAVEADDAELHELVSRVTVDAIGGET